MVDFVSAIVNAVAAVLSVAWQALMWAAHLYVDAVKFWVTGQVFAAQIAKSMMVAASQNPMAALGIVIAIAAGPPGWVGLAVAVAAQGMAMAAGIRDPQTLAIIGAVAGAVAGGVTLSSVLKKAAVFGTERAIEASGSPELATWGSLGSSLIVNAESAEPDLDQEVGPDTANRPGKILLARNDDPSDPNTASDAPSADYSQDAQTKPLSLSAKYSTDRGAFWRQFAAGVGAVLAGVIGVALAVAAATPVAVVGGLILGVSALVKGTIDLATLKPLPPESTTPDPAAAAP